MTMALFEMSETLQQLEQEMFAMQQVMIKVG